MVNYNFEYKYFDYKQKQRKYRQPIETELNNKHYKQKQLEIIRDLFPSGIKKEIKQDTELILRLFPNGLNKQIKVIN